jgi:hypothetical protein
MSTPLEFAFNPVLLKLASEVANRRAAQSWQEKSAIVPAGSDPSQGGAPPPGGDPAQGGAPPPDPMAAAGGAAPPPAGGDQTSQVANQVMQMMQQQGGGPMGKGKPPKDQIMQGQMKILMHLVAQLASKQGITVDPQLLVPATDPGTDQMAMQEMAGASMAPSNDPNAPQGDPNAAGGSPPPGPGAPQPPAPMDPSQGPIKSGGISFDLGRVFNPNQGTPTPQPDFNAIINGSRQVGNLAARTRAALGV